MINRVKIPIKDDEGKVLYEMNLRDYAISIWTLQDVFINVLKGFNSDIPGMIMDPHMTLSDDGTQDLSFTIPMYIKQNKQLIENPIWYNTRNGNLIANMRKIKVIFRKTQDKEKIYEFLITQIEESHSDDQLMCSLTCEGLAFHELGKIGYKHELSSDQFLAEYNEWADGEKTIPEPVNNLQYWVEHQLGIPPLPTGEGAVIDPQVWYYKVDMNWDAYVDSATREPNIVYEEGYVSSWTDDEASKPKSTVSAHEKLAMLDENESNDYNLTQAIAEKFRVHCRYEYGHDEHYHITSRTIIFYNNFIKEAEGYLGFIYPYSTNDISRSMDSTDIITKMYVRSIEDDSTDSGLITIMDSEANKSREDYIFNFDYLYEIGAVDSDILEDVKKHENELRGYNNLLVPLQEKLITINDNLNKAKADLAFAENSIVQDQEQLSKNNNQMAALDAVDGVVDNKLSVKADAPKMGIVVEDKSGQYTITISEKGVIYNSIKVYETMTVTREIKPVDSQEGQSESSQAESNTSEEETTPAESNDEQSNNSDTTPPTEYIITKSLDKEITILKGEFDDCGNLTKIYVKDKPESRPTVYLTYDYQPKLYWDNIAKMWNTRLAKDTKSKNDAALKVSLLENQRAYTEELIKGQTLLKQQAISKFNQHLGPAIREGNWTPEDYKNCEDRFSDSFIIVGDNSFINVAAFSDVYQYNDDGDELIYQGYRKKGNTNYISFIWDKTLFSGELDDHYELGIAQETVKYPWIDLSSISSELLNNDALTIVYHDFEEDEEVKPYMLSNARFMGIGASSQFGFILEGNNVQPALILTGCSQMSDDEFKQLKDNAYLACITSNEEGVLEESKIISLKNQIKGENKFSASEQWQIVYPRIEFNTLSAKTDKDNLIIKYNKLLEPYTDYQVLSREGKLYVTIKPEVIIRNGGMGQLLNVDYTISRASTAIYLDAVEVLKENSRPQVSYSIKPSVFNLEFMHTAYEALDRIVNINDTQLKFENVQGYITKLDLNLDNPWEDSIEVKNYKTKFEDLFTSIVASTEDMKRNSELYTTTANLFNRDGTIKDTVLQSSITNADLNYSFNNGALTIDPINGIWGVSESGVVAVRGGGIFTATEKDVNGNWIWNTGILPSGINADLLTAGQLDTNKILIYAGDEVRFQMNSSGLYAYKRLTDDEYVNGAIAALAESAEESPERTLLDQFNKANPNQIDTKQYVVHNPDGLFLRAEEGAWIYANDPKGGNEPKLFQLDQQIDRVSISWDGLTLHNWKGDKVFYADPNTGDLTLTGTVTATEFIALGNGVDFKVHGNDIGFYDASTGNAIMVIDAQQITAEQSFAITSGQSINLIADGTGIDISNNGIKMQYQGKNDDSPTIIAQLLPEYTKNDKVNPGGVIINTDTIEMDTIAGTFKLKNGDTSLLSYNGTGLSVTGDATFTGTINATGGTFTGNIDASKGTITGAAIKGGSLGIGTYGENDYGNFVVEADGTLTARSATIYGDIYADSGTFSGDISAANINIGGDNDDIFTVDAETGAVTAKSITIGSGDNILTYDGKTLSVTGDINATTGTFSGDVKGAAIKGGSINVPETDPLFSVTSAGAVTATSITIGSDSKGKLTYTSGNGLVVSTNSKLGNWTIGDDYLYNDTTTGAGFGIGSPEGTWTFVVDKSSLKFGSKFSVTGGGSITCGGVTTAQLNITSGIQKGTLSGDTFTASENFITDNWTGDINFSGTVTVNTLKTNNTTVKLITAMNTDSNGYVTSMTIGGQPVNFTKAADITVSGASTNVSNTAIIYPYHTGKRSRLGTNYKNITLSRSWVGYTVTVDAYLDNNIIASNTTDYSQDISNAQSSAISNLDIEYNDNRNITADGDNWKIYYTGDISGYILVPKTDIPSSKE